MEDLSASVRLTYCVADVRETTARLFSETPCERSPAIASSDGTSVVLPVPVHRYSDFEQPISVLGDLTGINVLRQCQVNLLFVSYVIAAGASRNNSAEGSSSLARRNSSKCMVRRRPAREK
jgi:hypothetical protein